MLMSNFGFRLPAARVLVLYLIAASSAVAFGQNKQAATRSAIPSVVSDLDCDHSKHHGLGAARKVLVSFLQISNDAGSFHVHGWRWHTMSLLREADRLRQLARRWESESPRTRDDFLGFKQATDYVVGFNMKGLHNIETSLFFPWAREKINATTDPIVAEAFGTMMDHLEDDCRAIERIGTAMAREVAKASKSTHQKDQISAIKSVGTESAQIVLRLRSVIALEESLLVPLIARVVSESDQKSFNRRVISKLGVLDSRLHLVGMHEAVTESNDAKEMKMFEQAIPSIPRKLIPRWKRLLYQPQVKVLELL